MDGWTDNNYKRNMRIGKTANGTKDKKRRFDEKETRKSGWQMDTQTDKHRIRKKLGAQIGS
jgi:hypothetical protein